MGDDTSENRSAPCGGPTTPSPGALERREQRGPWGSGFGGSHGGVSAPPHAPLPQGPCLSAAAHGGPEPPSFPASRRPRGPAEDRRVPVPRTRAATSRTETTSQEIGRGSDPRRAKQGTGLWGAARHGRGWRGDWDPGTEACCGEGRGRAEKGRGFALSGTGIEAAGRASWPSPRAPLRTHTRLRHRAHSPAVLFSFLSG